MMVAGCYARKSTDEGDKAADAKSVVRQVQRAREFAAKKGWQFNENFVFTDDGISGAEFAKRPGLNNLLNAIKAKHRLGALIVSEQSRLGRDTIRTLAVIQAINDADVKIYSYLEDRLISVDDEMGEVEQFMKSWAGSSERRKASERVRDKMRQLAEQGKSTGGKLYGYETTNGQRTIKLGEAAVIRRIFKRRAEGAGYFKIARELEKDGILSPRGGKSWSPTQVGAILANESYVGINVWGRTRQTRRRGTSVTVKSPDAVVKTRVPALAIITTELWVVVQTINRAAAEVTWRSPDGRLKSRPTESKHLLTPFLSCGVCGGSMHVRRDKKRREFLICTNLHRYGKAKCPNTSQLAVGLAERVILNKFAEALVGRIVMVKLEEVLERHRAAQADPAPLQAEAKRLRAEVGRLVDSLAKGDVEEIHTAITARKARLAEIEDQLSGLTAIQGIDDQAFRTGVEAELETLLADCRAHLRKNTSTAQQVLRKILPEKLRVTPQPGGWWFEGMTNYSKVLDELGFATVKAALEKETKVPGSGCRPCR